MIRPFARAIAAAVIAMILGAGIAVTATALPASAENLGVSANCSTLTVKPNGFASKGEVRVLVDGEVQTEGTDDGWRSFKGSFSGVYTFEPTVAHDYEVQINSFGADSDGRGFAPGTGYDATYTGPTTACAPVDIAAAASNCVSPSRIDKQSINLTFSELRRSVTYLAEVVLNGDVVTHFQFRTAPVVQKTFSGLTAGEKYEIRLTDQSDDSLSARAFVPIAGCADRSTVTLTAGECAPRSGGSSLSAELTGLVDGREYTLAVSQSAGDRSSRAVAGGKDTVVTFADVPAGAYTVTLSDDAAPRVTTSEPVTVAECADGSGAGGAAGPGSSSGTASSGSTTGSVATSHAGRLGGRSTSASQAAGSTETSASAGIVEDGTPAVDTPVGSAPQTDAAEQLPTLAADASSDQTGVQAVWTIGALAAVLLIAGLFLFFGLRRRRA
ncbi:hypothetical protein ACFSBZ_12990 [Amnibacterium flavum]|uniref:Uncharacterized protein n=1 Tax=Amnibacterium flavum TaxID=2173173 RepID=A0A2V1HWW2_9MICO|nr:hypothetical protein [Amnibacterium flavum]PVZ95690.1 hypothetical protein DDQ50_04200 [Amnibacterium flavum]